MSSPYHRKERSAQDSRFYIFVNDTDLPPAMAFLEKVDPIKVHIFEIS